MVRVRVRIRVQVGVRVKVRVRVRVVVAVRFGVRVRTKRRIGGIGWIDTLVAYSQRGMGRVVRCGSDNVQVVAYKLRWRRPGRGRPSRAGPAARRTRKGQLCSQRWGSSVA